MIDIHDKFLLNAIIYASKLWDVPIPLLRSNRKDGDYVKPRAALSYILCKEFKYNVTVVGSLLNRKHCTISNMNNVIHPSFILDARYRYSYANKYFVLLKLLQEQKSTGDSIFEMIKKAEEIKKELEHTITLYKELLDVKLEVESELADVA